MKKSVLRGKENPAIDVIWTELAATADLAVVMKAAAHAVPDYNQKPASNILGAMETVCDVMRERITDSLIKLEEIET